MNETQHPQAGSPWYRLVQRLAPRMRFPQLFTVLLGLLVLDLFLPDPVWFVDEILLGLLTVLIGMIRTREPEPPVEVHEPPVEVHEPPDEPAQPYGS
jgi:hypothetical protein